MSEIIPNKCFAGYCKFAKQGEQSMYCSSHKKILYYELTEPCPVCKRKPGQLKPACGNCIGRGRYIYPNAYEDCDCSGYEINNRGKAILEIEEAEAIQIAEKLNSY